MLITVNDKVYELHIAYQKNERLRKSFNHLVEKIFHLSYESWYQAGYWGDKYIPYTLFDKETALANVSVNIMHFEVLGELKRYIQICTVMTAEEHRERGLSRFLMEFVLEQWRDKCDLIYLYADNKALDIYPKFDFKPAKETMFFKAVSKTDNFLAYEKLDMDNPSHSKMLYDYVQNTKPFGKLAMQHTAHLAMFYCLSFLKNDVFYVSDLDAIIVASFNENQALLWDVFSPITLTSTTILAFFNAFEVDYVQFGFTPRDSSSCSSQELVSGYTLFIHGEGSSPFVNNNLRFPQGHLMKKI
ncbi:GNAT family N-acetyltransferase [Legionella sp. km772]|uniref:GNAT family N-acetyltransferase n=1 Tax=Legionella sp. km772 TaxID=2498111 RepID=UPI00131580EE|nr:GNAT family N-acetyltransferase [Legionella sp. km772]